MPRLIEVFRAARPRHAAMVFAAVAGFATAALVGVALGKTFTLQIAKNAKVTDMTTMSTSHENIAVNSRGRAVYELGGDSPHHPECTRTNGCFQFWPPVTVSSAKKLSKAPGLRGSLGVWHRGGFIQVTLGGHPLYTFAGDSQKHVATGEGIKSFGGTWHVTKASTSKGTGTTTGITGTTTTTTTSAPTTTTTTTTTTTPPCQYPPCY